MKYAIKSFVFDTEQLLLMRDGQIITFRANEARLLALLLSEPCKLFSKEEILETVWAGKVVAEQAVFQNIRNLRALFGEESIKTFSKKGYQWQLPLTPVEGDLPAINHIKSTPITKTFSAQFIAANLVLACLLLASAIGLHRHFSASPLPKVAVLLLSDNAESASATLDSLWTGLKNSDGYEGIKVDNQAVPEDFFHVPQKYFPSISQAVQAPYVMMAKVAQQPDGLRVRYFLKSKVASWQAEHYAHNASGLAELMNQHLHRLVNSGLLEIDERNAELMAAKLKLLQSQYPQDLNVLHGLVDLQRRSGDAASARVLAKSLQAEAIRQQDNLMLGNGYLAEADVYIAENLLADAQAPLAKAEAIFQAINDRDKLVKIEEKRISIAVAQNNYQHVQAHVEQALKLGRSAGDVLGQYHLNTWAAVLAHKFQRNEDSSAYLQAAKAVLDKNQRDADLYGLIHFYAGMFEQDEAAAEAHYRKVIELIPADQQWWERERAEAHLSELLVKQSRWQDALDLYANQTLGATQELLVGNIWLAQRDWAKAETHGTRSFEKAKLNGHLQNALDAAAYLLQLDQLQQRPADNFYRQFLLKEAANVPHWIRFNKSTIEELGLDLKEPESRDL